VAVAKWNYTLLGWAVIWSNIRPATALTAALDQTYLDFQIILGTLEEKPDAPHLVALVRAGARFEKGALIKRPDESAGDQQVA
jgi:hypothetical protein